MKMEIENIPSCSIAYIRQIGAYGEKNIQTMEQLKYWAKTNNLMNSETVILGIVHDNPQTTPPEYCRYDACIFLADDKILASGNINNGSLVGGKYAVFTVRHTPQALEQAWVEMFPALFKRSLILDATRPILERYMVKQIEHHLCELCVPIC